jgi:hypothetical protein
VIGGAVGAAVGIGVGLGEPEGSTVEPHPTRISAAVSMSPIASVELRRAQCVVEDLQGPSCERKRRRFVF